MKTKKIKTISISVIILITVFNSYAQKFNNAGEYMQFMGNEFKEITNQMWDYTSAAAHGKKARTVENKRKELISQISSSINKIKKMPGFEGSTAYRDSVLSYLQLNKLVLNEDYAKIVDMEEVSEQSYDAMEAYMLAKEMAEDKQDAAGAMIDKEEKKFAGEHGINLIESKDKISDKLKEAGKVYKYQNEIYLIFFKSHKQEYYLIEAMNKNDFNALEQNKNALAKVSAEGKKKLESVKDYKGDLTMKIACMDLMKFYESEATKFDVISAFYLQKEKFEKLKSSFESKKDADKSQKDVDQFNQAVNDMNAASKKSNAVNDELNQTRTKLLQKWNDSSERLADKFVPKKK